MAPRQRFIHPEIWDDPDLGRVTPLAFILYVGCFSNADDDGRLIGDCSHLKSQVFRYRPEVTLDDVLSARDELAAACTSFVVYEKNGIEYVCFRNWNDYQKPKYPKPSKLPPPPGWKRHKPAKTSEKSSGNDSGNSSPNASHNDSRNDSTTGLGRVGLGTKELSTTPTAPHNAADAEDREHALARLENAGWTRSQLSNASSTLNRAIAWLDHAEELHANGDINSIGAFAWAKFQTGTSPEPAEQQSTLAPGALGATRSTKPKPLPFKCNHDRGDGEPCGSTFGSQTRLDEHTSDCHTQHEQTPPPPEIAALIAQTTPQSIEPPTPPRPPFVPASRARESQPEEDTDA